MEEKTIIKGEKGRLLYIASLIPGLIGLIITICIFCDGGFSAWCDYAFECDFGDIEPLLAWGGLFLIIAGLTIFLSGKNTELCVTNKRIYGIALFGNRVDIPIDSVSAVGLFTWCEGITVSSSSGVIRFLYISNANKIHEEISKILMARYSNNKTSETSSVADELKKLKELVDSNILTQEEFELKKKQLLNL